MCIFDRFGTHLGSGKLKMAGGKLNMGGGKLNMGNGKLNMGDGKLNMAGATCTCDNDAPRLVHIGVSEGNVLGRLGSILAPFRAPKIVP